MTDVTRVLSAIELGDAQAAEQLLPLVYDELRRLASAKMAQERPGQTLQATALVHEAYLRLIDADKAQQWDSRGHFFAAAAEAMRRILVENARKKRRIKRGGDRARHSLLDVDLTLDPPDDELLALEEALTMLCQEKPEIGRVVKLRFFAGLTIDDAAAALGVSSRTVRRHWTYGRAWLRREIDRDGSEPKND